MNTLFYKYLQKSAYTASIALAVATYAQPGHAATLSLTDTPLFLSTGADPNVLINMSVETPMGGAAYTDNAGVPSGCSGRTTVGGNTDIGTCYFPATTYLGYFHPNKCYTYSSNRFEATGMATNHVCSSLWSGNFLNWATMTAIDMFTLSMTGGNRITDTTSETIVRRARKQNNDSWFPRKAVGTGVSGSVASSTVTPYSEPVLYIYNTDYGFRIGTSLSNVRDGSGSSPGLRGSFNVSVKACDLAQGTLNVESNCTSYGSYSKPEGLIQRNAITKRFGVIGYTLDDSQSRGGGVLRSNMKYVGPTLPNGSTNSAREFETTGLLRSNPDGAASPLNSGVINYINKFSDPGYKSYDPVSELFYESVRYFKALGPTPEYSSGLTDAQKGGFQIVSSWTDPMQYRCQKNFIVAINDANPWLDKKLPGTFFTSSTFTGAGGYGTVTLDGNDYGTPGNADTAINVTALTNEVGRLEGLNGIAWTDSGTWTSTGSTSNTMGVNDSVGGGVGTFDNSCSNKTPGNLGEIMGTCPYPAKQNSYYVAGLAYYANTTDLRTTTGFENDRGIQNVQTFMIDTQEYNSNPLDGPKNMLWLTGKYGGFVDKNGDRVPQASEWDADGNGSPDNYVLATQPQNLVSGLSRAFDFIDRQNSSAASASVNSGSISSGTRIYQARFNSGDWTGQLWSFSVDASTGTLTRQTTEDAKIPAAASRQIITRNSNGTPVAFTAAALDAARLDELVDVATPATPATAAQTAMINYLRGDSTLEVLSGGAFRDRPEKLGDIVSSSPLFIGRPPFRYRDSFEASAYSTFTNNNASRNMVLVGANDGMLHAFRAGTAAGTGNEIFAYIPGKVVRNLNKLASQGYTHQYYVDGPPSMGDAYFGSAWHTVVAGGLNKGGQAVYALDVTNPALLATAQSNPGSIALWEFTDTDNAAVAGSQGDRDLGYTYSQPSIVKTMSGRSGSTGGKWAAVFGNGYNNTETDGNASTTGNAVLYVVDIQTGTVLEKIDTGVGTADDPTGLSRANGLATPSLVDVNGDRIVDFAYAGDLFGNLWKFDLRSPNDDNWKVAFADGSGNPLPLFQAKDAVTGGNAQPITVRPEVARGPGGRGVIVLFGTGKYLEPSDEVLSPQRTQSFYGIIDRNTGADTDRIASRSDLTQQRILAEKTIPDPDSTGPLTALNLRATTDNPISTSRGWYIDLLSPSSPTYRGERSVSNPIVRNGNVIFSTLIPDVTPCEFGGTSWIMEMDMLDGSRLDVSPFDVNNDGQFTNSDTQTFTLPDGTTITVNASGAGSNEGILNTPGVVDGNFVPTGGTAPGHPVQYKYAPGSSGSIQKIIERPGEGGIGRQSWRQVR